MEEQAPGPSVNKPKERKPLSILGAAWLGCLMGLPVGALLGAVYGMNELVPPVPSGTVPTLQEAYFYILAGAARGALAGVLLFVPAFTLFCAWLGCVFRIIHSASRRASRDTGQPMATDG
jgi:hypothetical protein